MRRHLVRLSIVLSIFCCGSCISGRAAWIDQVTGQLRCGMTPQEIKTTLGSKTSFEQQPASWRGNLKASRGNVAVWLTIKDDALQSIAISREKVFNTKNEPRFSARTNLCTGVRSVSAAIIAPRRFSGATIVLNGDPVGKMDNIGPTRLDLPMGFHSVKLEREGVDSISRSIHVDQRTEGNYLVSFLADDLKTPLAMKQ